MASNLLAMMASTLLDDDGLQPTCDDGLQPTCDDGPQPTCDDGPQSTCDDGLQPTCDDGLQPTCDDGLQPTCDDGLQPTCDGLQPKSKEFLEQRARPARVWLDCSTVNKACHVESLMQERQGSSIPHGQQTSGMWH